MAVEQKIVEPAYRVRNDQITMPGELWPWLHENTLVKVLPEGPYHFISNIHTEMEVVPEDLVGIDAIRKAMDDVTLIDGRKFQADTPTEKLDIYGRLPSIPSLTVRLRLNWKEGSLQYASWIFATDSKISNAVWLHDGFTVEARREQLFVMVPIIAESSEDEHPGAFRFTSEGVREVITKFRRTFTASKLVAKTSYGGRFPGADWKHMSGKKHKIPDWVDIPNNVREGIVNTVPYISLGAFERVEVSLDHEEDLLNAFIALHHVGRANMSPRNVVAQLYPNAQEPSRKVELECGAAYYEDGAFVTKQLVNSIPTKWYGAAPRTMQSAGNADKV